MWFNQSINKIKIEDIPKTTKNSTIKVGVNQLQQQRPLNPIQLQQQRPLNPIQLQQQRNFYQQHILAKTENIRFK